MDNVTNRIIRRNMDKLADILPEGYTLTYYGNVERWGDERQWYIDYSESEEFKNKHLPSSKAYLERHRNPAYDGIVVSTEQLFELLRVARRIQRKQSKALYTGSKLQATYREMRQHLSRGEARYAAPRLMKVLGVYAYDKAGRP